MKIYIKIYWFNLLYIHGGDQGDEGDLIGLLRLLGELFIDQGDNLFLSLISLVSNVMFYFTMII